MEYRQLDMIEAGIAAHMFDKDFDILGASIHSFRTSGKMYSSAMLISAYSSPAADGLTLTGRSSEMRRMLSFLLSQIPNSDIFDSGRYCLVSNMGTDMLITLTKKGAKEIAENGVIEYMFQEMQNGTKLKLYNSESSVVFGPNVRLLYSARDNDERIWHLPDCETKGTAFFWKTLRENGYVRLELLNR